MVERSAEQKISRVAEAAEMHVILPHTEALRILLLPQGEGWILPRFIVITSEIEDVYDLFHSGMKAKRVLECSTETLYTPYFEWENDTHGFRFTFVVHNLDAAYEAPEGARWADSDDIGALTLADEYLRPTLTRYFEERTTELYPLERPPWAFPGWTQRANAWIEAQVGAQGWTLTGDIELVRKWCITCVLKVPTNVGDLYFKAVPPTFAREVAVTCFLAERHPANIPALVATNEEERWLLMRDFGKAYLGESKKAGDWERAVRDFAALQISMSGQVDALFARGAMDYRLETLPEKLTLLFADETMFKPDHAITAEEIERVKGLYPRICALIDELNACALPVTIVHGDFHVWNTAVQDGRIIFFDWTDAAVGHPFWDIALYFEAARQSDVFADQREIPAYLLEVYLQAWSGFAPMDVLQKALALGEFVALVHQAVNYRHLLRSIEPVERWTLQSVGQLVKKMLLWLEEVERSEGEVQR